MFDLLWLLVAIPLLSSAILMVWGKESDAFGHLIATVASAASFVLGVVLFIGLLNRPENDRAVGQTIFTWIDAGPFQVDMSLLFDPLSALFVLLVTGVGTLIHIYSIGYMAHDYRRRRFFAYLNLFVASMLTVVLASDYLVLFLGWEGVGLSSYLLIGFWQHKHVAAFAAKKAFIVNRVGDVGMSLAIMMMFAQFGSSSFAAVDSGMQDASGNVATALGLLLLLGACAKSAQVPLQSWLLDAMEGPTPVSALIHAATMVTAGVYLVVRSSSIYDASSAARTAVIVVGLVTLLFGAYIGCAKDDIKRALAGSTMSQIGYMMLAAGLGPAGYAFAIFHLITHGFFKANMFLGAGSVMHGMDDEVNMRHYGALNKAMPITFLTFAFGYLAIIGFPGFSGFFSKDKIIEAAFGYSVWVGLGALLGAGVTGFYMTRMMIMTFTSKKRWRDGVEPHESPRVMTWPLIALAAFSLLAGVMAIGGWINNWLAPVVGNAEHHELAIAPIFLTMIITVVVALGVTAAFFTYATEPIAAETPSNRSVSLFTRAGRADLYQDAINDAIVIRPTTHLTRFLVYLDGKGIDGVVTGIADLVGDSADQLRKTSNGFVRSYALGIFGGALVVVLALLAVNLA